MNDATVPVEEFYAFISKGLFDRPENHQKLAEFAIPTTHEILSFSAQKSNADLFTGKQQFALVIYAYKREDKQ